MRRTSILLLVFVLIFCISNNVYAASSFSATISASPTTVKPGGTVTITIGISNVSNKIWKLEADFEYPKDIFQQVTEVDVTAQGDWDLESYTPNTNTADSFQLENSLGADVAEAVLKITLKVKSTVAQTSATVAVNNIEGTDSLDDTVTSSRKEVKIAIEKPAEVIPTPTPAPIEDKKEEKLPNTGVNDTIMYILMGALLWGIGSFIVYKKYNSIKI